MWIWLDKVISAVNISMNFGPFFPWNHHQTLSRGEIFKGGFQEQDNWQYEYEIQVSTYKIIRKGKTTLIRLSDNNFVVSCGSPKFKQWWISSSIILSSLASGLHHIWANNPNSFSVKPWEIVQTVIDPSSFLLLKIYQLKRQSFSVSSMCLFSFPSFHDGRVMVNYPWDDR